MRIGEGAERMESPMLMLGLIPTLATPIGILLYVALVIAIPICLMLYWFFFSEPENQAARPRPSS